MSRARVTGACHGRVSQGCVSRARVTGACRRGACHGCVSRVRVQHARVFADGRRAIANGAIANGATELHARGEGEHCMYMDRYPRDDAHLPTPPRCSRDAWTSLIYSGGCLTSRWSPCIHTHTHVCMHACMHACIHTYRWSPWRPPSSGTRIPSSMP